jgi:uncharacterized membrane protein YjjP (DUF1212 family)
LDAARHDGPTRPSVDALEAQRAAVSALLLDLGTALHGAALPAPLVESRVRAVAGAFGARAEVFILQGFLTIEVEQGSVARVDLRRISFDTHWNLRRVHELADLVAALGRGELNVTAGRAELERILAEPLAYAKWIVVISYGLYGAAVAARVGGGGLEALAGGLIGLLAGIIHFGTIRSRRVDLQKSFLAALVGGFAALALTLVLPPFDASRALFGGITLLVPAMVVTIGTYELANEALESGMARLAYGILRFLMLGFGIAVALRVFPLFAPLPPRVAATPFPLPLVLALVAIGGAALTACLQGRKMDLPWIAGAVLFAFGAQELTKVLFGGRGSPMLSALLLGVAAHGYGRLTGKVPATVVIPGLLQLAPGFLGTQAVFNLLGSPAGASAGGEARFFDVFMTALQLVVGLLLADVLHHFSPSMAPKSGRETGAQAQSTVKSPGFQEPSKAGLSGP